MDTTFARLSVVFAALVVLAGCSAPVESFAAGAPAAPADESAPTISVSATGDVEADPDIAVVHVAVEHTAPSADEARRRVAEDVEQMRAALRDAGVPDDAVSTSSFGIFPEYDYSDRERELTGYRASHSFRIELDDTSRAGEIIDVAVTNGATRVGGVQFTLSEEARRDLRADALAEAMTDARSDADALAAAADLSIVGVHSVSTSEDGGSGPVPLFAERDAGGGGQTTIEPGRVTVTASVSVEYVVE